MCNLYSITTAVEAMRNLFEVAPEGPQHRRAAGALRSADGACAAYAGPHGGTPRGSAHGLLKDGGRPREWLQKRRKLNQLVREARENERLVWVPHATRARQSELACRRAGTGVLLVITLFQRLQERDQVVDLIRLEAKLRHLRMAGQNAFREGFFEVFNRIEIVKVTKGWRTRQLARANPVDRVAF